MWQPGTELIHKYDSPLFVLYADMYMQTKDQNGTTNVLKLFFYFDIAFLISSLLMMPERKRMCASTDECKALFIHKPRKLSPHRVQFLTGGSHIRQDVRY